MGKLEDLKANLCKISQQDLYKMASTLRLSLSCLIAILSAIGIVCDDVSAACCYSNCYWNCYSDNCCY